MGKNPIRAAREAAGLSKSEAARLAGVTRMTVYLIERGANPTLSTLQGLARAYGVPVSDLVRDAVPA